MRIALNAKILGLASGGIAGLLFVLLGWRSFLILLAFTLFGLCLGMWLDAQPGLARRLREVFTRFLSS